MAPLVHTLTDGAPCAHFTDGAPVPTLLKAPPVPTLLMAPPVPTLLMAPPVPTLTDGGLASVRREREPVGENDGEVRHVSAVSVGRVEALRARHDQRLCRKRTRNQFSRAAKNPRRYIPWQVKIYRESNISQQQE